MLNEALNAAEGFFTAPFQEPVSTTRLFLIVGLVIVFGVIWSRVLNHIVE
jgi:hypothetical protein